MPFAFLVKKTDAAVEIAGARKRQEVSEARKRQEVSEARKRQEVSEARKRQEVSEARKRQEVSEARKYPVARVARALEVSRPNLHRRLKGGSKSRRPRRRADEASILQKIYDVIIDHATYGYRRVTAFLKRLLGTKINHKRVYRLMKENNLLLRKPRRNLHLATVWMGYATEHQCIDDLVKLIVIATTMNNFVQTQVVVNLLPPSFLATHGFL